MAKPSSARGKSPRPPSRQPSPAPPATSVVAAPVPAAKPKNKSKKITSYRSEGVEDHDVFLLPVSDYYAALAVTLVATAVRLFKIYTPTSVVFDEVQ